MVKFKNAFRISRRTRHNNYFEQMRFLLDLSINNAFLNFQVDYYGAMYCRKDYKEMVRLTSRKILADEFLKDYSFLGRTKLPFIEYNKVLDLIVQAVAKRYPTEEKSILNYFKDYYIKTFPGRCKNKQ